jgi:hypothetical protein
MYTIHIMNECVQFIHDAHPSSIRRHFHPFGNRLRLGFTQWTRTGTGSARIRFDDNPRRQLLDATTQCALQR